MSSVIVNQVNVFDFIKSLESIDKSIISHYEQSLLIRMYMYGDKDGSNIYPSMATLAKNLKVSVKTIERVIKSARHKCFIIIEQVYSSVKHKAYRYRINLPLILSLAVDKKRISPPPPVSQSGGAPDCQSGNLPLIPTIVLNTVDFEESVDNSEFKPDEKLKSNEKPCMGLVACLKLFLELPPAKAPKMLASKYQLQTTQGGMIDRYRNDIAA